MNTDIDYYAVLGVSETASDEEIKRAFSRKRKENEGKDEILKQINAARENLGDKDKRREYDNRRKYGEQIERLEGIIVNSKTEEEYVAALINLRNIYEDELKECEDIEALKAIYDISIQLKDDSSYVSYLSRISKIISEMSDDSKKCNELCWLASKYKKQGDREKLLSVYQDIFNYDKIAYHSDEIIEFARILCDDRNNLKNAIYVLNESIKRSKAVEYKARYYCECLRIVVQSDDASSFKKTESYLISQIKGLKADEETNEKISGVIINALSDDRTQENDLQIFRDLYYYYGINNEQFEQIYTLQKLRLNGDIHEVIELMLEDEWTLEIRKQIRDCFIKDYSIIKKSLYNLIESVPLLKEYEQIKVVVEFIDENDNSLSECQVFNSDASFGNELKSIINMVLFAGIYDDSDETLLIWEKYAADIVRPESNKAKDEIWRLNISYPSLYSMLSVQLMKGLTVKELLGDYTENLSSDCEKNTKIKPYISGWIEAIIIVIATCIFPPAFPIIFGIKYINRHKTKVLRIIKILLIVIIIIAVVCGVLYFLAFSDIKTTNQEEQDSGHNNTENLIKQNNNYQNVFPDYDQNEFVGDWSDAWSGRCNMTITKAEQEGYYNIIIQWSSSASQSTYWDLQGYYSDEGKIEYTGKMVERNTTEDGYTSESLIYENGTGVLQLTTDGKIIWTDNVENAGQDCLFEKDNYVAEASIVDSQTPETEETTNSIDNERKPLLQGRYMYSASTKDTASAYVYSPEITGGQYIISVSYIENDSSAIYVLAWDVICTDDMEGLYRPSNGEDFTFRVEDSGLLIQSGYDDIPFEGKFIYISNPTYDYIGHAVIDSSSGSADINASPGANSHVVMPSVQEGKAVYIIQSMTTQDGYKWFNVTVDGIEGWITESQLSNVSYY